MPPIDSIAVDQAGLYMQVEHMQLTFENESARKMNEHTLVKSVSKSVGCYSCHALGKHLCATGLNESFR